jgi:hypothetical protein
LNQVNQLAPHIAYCGLDCSGCDVYQATKLDSNDIRQKYADKVFSQFKIKLEPETINCHGCRDERPKTGYCAKFVNALSIVDWRTAPTAGIMVARNCKKFMLQ